MVTIENGCSGSTTYVWRKVKIQAPPRPKGTARAKRAPMSGPDAPQKSPEAELRAPHHVQIRFRGGADTWWEITWGGTTKRFPGHVPLDDALLCLFTHGAGCHIKRAQSPFNPAR